MTMSNISRRVLLSHGTVAATALIGAAIGSAYAAPPAGRRIALGGHDPVSYFTDGHPQKGSDAFWFAFDDAIYLFRSAEHRAMFAADPERYAPQYDGFCAAGVSKGYKVEPDPEAWVIANGKLYVLMLKERVPDFKKDTAAFVDKANANWPALRDAPVRPR
jgi:hypothetical protein